MLLLSVPNRNIKDFESSPAAVITKPLGKTNGATIYKVQNNIFILIERVLRGTLF